MSLVERAISPFGEDTGTANVVELWPKSVEPLAPAIGSPPPNPALSSERALGLGREQPSPPGAAIPERADYVQLAQSGAGDVILSVVCAANPFYLKNQLQEQEHTMAGDVKNPDANAPKRKLALRYEETAAQYVSQCLMDVGPEEMLLNFSSGYFRDPASGAQTDTHTHRADLRRRGAPGDEFAEAHHANRSDGR